MKKFVDLSNNPIEVTNLYSFDRQISDDGKKETWTTFQISGNRRLTGEMKWLHS